MLENKSCIPCQRGGPTIDIEEAKMLLKEIPQWEIFDNDTKIKRKYTLNSFVSAMNFSVSVGELCETTGHHADITFGWGYCEVQFYTHKIKGLHENDFIMAAKTDAIFNLL